MSVFSSELSSELPSELSSELKKGIMKIEEHSCTHDTYSPYVPTLFYPRKKGISKLFIKNYDTKIELF